MNYIAEKKSSDGLLSLVKEADGDMNLVIHCLNECKKEAENTKHNVFSYEAVKNKIVSYKNIE